MPDIHVFENNAPLITIRLKKDNGDGTTSPYLLTGAPAIDFYAKNRKADTDANAKFHLSTAASDITITNDGSGPGAKYSEMTMRCKSTDLTPPGSYPFHLDVTKAAHPETVMANNFIIENT